MRRHLDPMRPTCSASWLTHKAVAGVWSKYWRTSFSTRSVLSGSRFAVGSSRSNTVGRLASKRSSAKRCFSPLESSRTGRSNSAAARPRSLSSSGLGSEKWSRVSSAHQALCGGSRPTSRRHCCGGKSLQLRPSRTLLPSWGSRSAIALSRRDFPEPDGPERHAHSRRCKSRLTGPSPSVLTSFTSRSFGSRWAISNDTECVFSLLHV